MEKICPKCNTSLKKCILFGAESKLSAVLPGKSFTEGSSALIPYVCSTCGYTEWYVKKPEQFK
jgi:hypothetical protein